MSKNKEKVEKPKEFNVTNEESSEYAFIIQTMRFLQETLGYWDYRRQETESRIKKRIGIITDEYKVSFDRIFSTQKVFVTKIPKPKVVSEKGENGKSQLQTKQEQGIQDISKS